MKAEPKEKLIRLRSTVRQIYAGVALLPGDRFPAPLPERIAQGLIRMHFAEDEALDIDVERPRRRYRRRDMKADNND